MSGRFGLVVLLDCEFTCWEMSMETGWADKRYPPEIIQIGLAVFDTKRDKHIEDYASYVRPRINPRLSDYCKKLLGLTQDVVDNAKDFCAVAEEIFNLLQSYEKSSIYTCAWGNDRDVVAENAARCDSIDPFSMLSQMDLQQIASNIFGFQDKLLTRESVKQKLGFAFSKDRHNALDDAMDLKNILDAIKRNKNREYIR
jgi:inhibitor of KinA sporulation pathway (predicted exonuclease)